ncbi:MAG: Cytochrome c oxidase subunit 2 [Holosporales bacterium]
MIPFLLFISLFFQQLFAAHPKEWQIGFQEACTPLMTEITKVHDMVFMIICAIGIVVTILLITVIYKFRESKNKVPATFTHHTTLEVVWTIIPILILAAILVPSIKILYVFDRSETPDITIKATGHQWYWSYEYMLGDQKISFDSYMIPEKDLKLGQLRLLDVDKPVVLPKGKNVRVLVTSQDVIHSFAVPAFGIKTDGIPGRINETWLRVEKEGMYYGQCSELCGKDHGFMPIAVKIVSQDDYKKWVDDQLCQKALPAQTLKKEK